DTTSSSPPLLSGPTKAPGTTGQFQLSAPADGAMVTTTRRPALSWAAVGGASSYSVYLNISRSDYDFTQPGNLLDLFTKVAQVTGTSYTPSWDISDRWTYKWYVVTNTGAVSNIRRFSLYLPVISTVADGTHIVSGARDLNKDGT